MTSPLASRGRGGAGNMADTALSPRLQPSDLETPVLKTSVVTTGRGGTGNMAKNKDPHETRLRQDVEAVPRRFSSVAQHAGRGGAGNVFKGDAELEITQRTSLDEAIDDSFHKSDKPEKTDIDPGTSATRKKAWIFSKKG